LVEMRRMLLNVLIIVAAITLLGLPTYTYLSDTESSTGNVFSNEQQDLKVWDASQGRWVDDPEVPNFDNYWNGIVNNLRPGDDRQILVPVKNEGSVGGKAGFQINNLVNNGGSFPEAERYLDPVNNGGLGRNIWMWLKYDDGTGPVLVEQGWLEDFAGRAIVAPAFLSGNREATWIVRLLFANFADNALQGDWVKCDIEFSLNQ